MMQHCSMQARCEFILTVSQIHQCDASRRCMDVTTVYVVVDIV